VDNFLYSYQQRINAILEKCLPDAEVVPTDLHHAMRYVVLNGGKRVRAALVYATGEALGVEIDKLDHLAAAVELVHAYSLVHDDLPAMDNDDLRRGKPTCHIAFNEAIAILTGDALQSLAFEMLATQVTAISFEKRLQIVAELAKAIGSTGMVGGQALDLAAETKSINLEELENIHLCKTGALIVASIKLGILASACYDKTTLKALEHFGCAVGLAFQVQDDIIDIESSTEVLGKQQGADRKKHKTTYASLLGIEKSKEYLIELYQKALDYLKEADLIESNLEKLAEFIIRRNH